jgi:hypothetical protein
LDDNTTTCESSNSSSPEQNVTTIENTTNDFSVNYLDLNITTDLNGTDPLLGNVTEVLLARQLDANITITVSEIAVTTLPPGANLTLSAINDLINEISLNSNITFDQPTFKVLQPGGAALFVPVISDPSFSGILPTVMTAMFNAADPARNNVNAVRASAGFTGGEVAIRLCLYPSSSDGQLSVDFCLGV